MQVVLLGPAHPGTGGIVHHTTELAHRLAQRAPVQLLTWWAPFPVALYPGTPFVPWSEPEQPRFPSTRYALAWHRPDTWWREGRRLRALARDDEVLLVLVVANPLQAVPYRALLRAAGRRVRTVGILHNVVPHEPAPHQGPLLRALLRRLDRVVVHSEALAAQARRAGARGEVVVADLAPHHPTRSPSARTDRRPTTLLSFGTVRRYKGLDLLLHALARVQGLRLVVAGEFWEPVEAYRRLVEELGLTDRVDLRPGYVAPGDIAPLFAEADVAVLPYRCATASQNVDLAAALGLPAVVTATGTLATSVRDGVDGLVVPPHDVVGLARALEELTLPGRLEALRRGLAHRPAPPSWDAYVQAVLRPGA